MRSPNSSGLWLFVSLCVWTTSSFAQDFLVNDVPPSHYVEQESPEIAVLDTSHVLLVWRERRPGGLPYPYAGEVLLRQRVFSRDGTAASDVCTVSTGWDLELHHAVASLGHDRYAILWSEGYSDSDAHLRLAVYEWREPTCTRMSQWGLYTGRVAALDVAADTVGNVVAAWLSRRGAADHVLVSVVDSSGNVVLPPDTLDRMTEGVCSLVRVAVEPAGSFAVLWARFDTLLVQWFDADRIPGPKIGSPTYTVATGGQWADIACARDGRVALAWHRKLPDGRESVLCRIYRSDGSAVGGTQILREPGLVRCSDVRAEFNRNGTLAVTWVERGLEGSSIRHRLVDRYGRISYRYVEPIYEGIVSPGALSLSADVDFVTAWELAGSPFMRSFSDGGRTGPLVELNDGGPRATNVCPRIVASPSGHFAVAWLQLQSNTVALKMRRFGPGARKLGDEMTLATRLARYRAPEVCSNHRNTTLLAWADSDHRIRVLRLDSLFQPVGEVIRTDLQLSSWNSPSLAVDSLGRFLVVSAGGGDLERRVYAQPFDADGVPLDSIRLLRRRSYYKAGYLFRTACAWVGRDRYLVAWSDERRVYGKFISTTGVDTSDVFILGPGPRGTWVTHLVVCATPAGALVSWVEREDPWYWDWDESSMPSSALPYARWVSTDGTLGPEFVLSELALSTDRSGSWPLQPLDVVPLDPHHFVAVWTLRQREVVGRFFAAGDTGGGWEDLAARLNTVAGSVSPGWVDADYVGHDVYVAWSDYRYNARTTNIYARIAPESFFYRPVSVEETTDDPLPGTVRLRPCWPNPFNASTRIRFELPKPAHVRLWLFDQLGRRIVRLLDGWTPAGTHYVTWTGVDASGRPVPSGVYLVRLEAGPHAVVRKVVLVR